MDTLTATYESPKFDSVSFYIDFFRIPLWEEPTSINLA